MNTTTESPPSYEAPEVTSESFLNVEEPAGAAFNSFVPSAPLGHSQSTAPPPAAGWNVPDTAAAKEKEAEASASAVAGDAPASGLYPRLPAEDLPSSPPQSIPTSCPEGLESLQGQTSLILRETFVPDHRGGMRRGAAVLSGADPSRTLLLVQRCPRGPHRHTRALELLDAAGGRVIALIESTKRADVLSVEVQCPPGCRVARTEVKPGPEAPQLAATMLSADEKAVLRTTLPPLGKLETQPTLQLSNASSGDDAEAFSRRWSSRGSGGHHGRLHMHGHRGRRHR
ncbi:hypothetical protein B566_EDAN010709 [Ephemera danica]|nr:hypothetical protein B566_EDAN010709 [Ephemera danica]